MQRLLWKFWLCTKCHAEWHFRIARVIVLKRGGLLCSSYASLIQRPRVLALSSLCGRSVEARSVIALVFCIGDRDQVFLRLVHNVVWRTISDYSKSDSLDFLGSMVNPHTMHYSIRVFLHSSARPITFNSTHEVRSAFGSFIARTLFAIFYLSFWECYSRTRASGRSRFESLDKSK